MSYKSQDDHVNRNQFKTEIRQNVSSYFFLFWNYFCAEAIKCNQKLLELLCKCTYEWEIPNCICNMPLADEFARKRSEFFTFILQTQIQAQITRSDLIFLSNLLMLSIDIF